jgi:hypothetical protein
MAEPFTPRDSIPPPEDIDGITHASRDYIEGWYTADAERMRRCLHPELVKRTLMVATETGTWLLRWPTTAEMLVKLTEQGGGSDVPEAERTVEITIQDVFRHIATVKVVSRDMLDYLHLVKLNDQWLIINALWELRAGEIKTGFEEMKEMVRESSDQLRQAAEQLNDARVKWEEMLNLLGDDAQLANVDLQNILQKQQQTLQMMSNISKMLYDTVDAVIRKMGG